MLEKKSPPIIRNLNQADARHAARVHLRSFPEFFLSSFGSGFLTEMYAGFATLPDGVALVAEADGRVVGSAVGSLTPNAFFPKLLRARFWRLSWYAVLTAVRRPRATLRIARGLVYRGHPTTGDGALLSSISVDPPLSGAGIGSLLLEEWMNRARALRAPGAFLTTDAVDNERVLAFYRRHGWTVCEEFVTREGRRMVCMHSNLETPA